MRITDLLQLPDKFITNAKIHFALGEKEKFEPLYAFSRNEFQKWQETQRNRNFEKEYILSLIYYGKGEWLFGGIYRRISLRNENKLFIYRTELTDFGAEFIGRLVVKFDKKFRQSYPNLWNYCERLELLEILRDKYTVEPFPGYENMKIKFELLQSIISQEEKTWTTALSIVKGVYLISDLSNGKLYFGAAFGENSFWNRWVGYTFNGHGGNADLKAIIDKEGFEYTKNFLFSILETRSMNAEDDEIIKRESYWKDILLTRGFGYNKN